MDAHQVWELIGEEFVDRDRLRQRSGDRWVSWDAGASINWETGETGVLA